MGENGEREGKGRNQNFKHFFLDEGGEGGNERKNPFEYVPLQVHLVTQANQSFEIPTQRGTMYLR